MNPEDFRASLHQRLDEWVAKGWINAEHAEAMKRDECVPVIGAIMAREEELRANGQRLWHGYRVSAEDHERLMLDDRWFGVSYLEVDDSGMARRIPPRNLVIAKPETSSVGSVAVGWTLIALYGTCYPGSGDVEWKRDGVIRRGRFMDAAGELSECWWYPSDGSVPVQVKPSDLWRPL